MRPLRNPAALAACLVLAATASAAGGRPTAQTPPAAAPTAATSTAAGDLPIRPGYWETRLSALLLGGRDRRCVHPEEVARFVGGPHNSVYACTYPTSVVAGGHVAWHGTCTSHGGQTLRLDADGTYTDTAMDLRGTVRVRLAGVPIAAPFTVRARRLGECSAFPSAPVVQRR